MAQNGNPLASCQKSWSSCANLDPSTWATVLTVRPQNMEEPLVVPLLSYAIFSPGWTGRSKTVLINDATM
jgi:hypothetical protein